MGCKGNHLFLFRYSLLFIYASFFHLTAKKKKESSSEEESEEEEKPSEFKIGRNILLLNIFKAAYK